MTGKYSREQLRHGGDSKPEHKRLRNIFEDLVLIGKSGLVLSAAEQAFVFHGVKWLNEDDTNYPFIDDEKFKYLYLTYFFDLTGGSKYYRTEGVTAIEVPLLERERDLEYLINSAEQWEVTVTPGTKQDILLQEVSKETNIDRKALDNSLNVKENPFIKGSFRYEYKRCGTYLRSKIVFLYCKEVFEEANPSDFYSTFCGETIEFTEFSFVHIFNRHFAELAKQYESGKDYHREGINPHQLHLQIKNIIEKINKSGLFSKQTRTSITVRYKSQLYQIWAEWKTKTVKGKKGEVKYKRLQSFYPISDASIIKDLESNWLEKQLTEDLAVFISQPNTLSEP